MCGLPEIQPRAIYMQQFRWEELALSSSFPIRRRRVDFPVGKAATAGKEEVVCLTSITSSGLL